MFSSLCALKGGFSKSGHVQIHKYIHWINVHSYTIICIGLLSSFLLVSNVNIMDCEISLHGDSSILLHGTNCTISGISVHDNGCGGIHMSGGIQVRMYVVCTYVYICTII